MRTFSAEGIVINRRNIYEADRLLTVLTRTHGKLVIRASGIRRIPSKRSSHVELFTHCFLQLYQGKGLPVLTEAQTVDQFSTVKEDFEKVQVAYQLCELVDGLCPENQENSEVFFLLKKTLGLLAATNERVDSFLRDFEIKLLVLLGFWNKSDIISEQDELDTMIELLLSRKLKSKQVFARIL